MTDTGTTHTAALKQGLKSLQALVRNIDKLSDALKKILKVEASGRNITLFAAGELAAARAALAQLAREEPVGPVSTLASTLSEMEEAARRSADRELVRLLGDLEKRLKESGYPLSGHYPELLCGVFTISFETTARGMTANIYYGPKIARLSSIAGGDVEKVATAVVDAQKELEGSLIRGEEFLEMVLTAWTMAHSRRDTNGVPGPLPVLEVLSELCFLRQTDRFRRNPIKAAFTPYGQVSFSYQLFLLEERESAGGELTLGIATREDVKNKESLWVPRNLKGLGTHYSTLGFRRT